VASGDPVRTVEQARELVDVLQGLEERSCDPHSIRPIQMVALNDSQVALIYSLAPVQKTGSTVDRPGQPRYGDVRDRWLACTAEELEGSGAASGGMGLEAWGGVRVERRRC
jgi:hypothetical protein